MFKSRRFTLIKTLYQQESSSTLLEQFWRISQYVTYDAITKLYVT